MRKSLLIFFTAMLMLAGNAAQAQSWEIGVSTGASGYIGDFNPNNPLKFTDVEFGAFVKRNINPWVSIRANYNHGSIQGDDATSYNDQLKQRNLSFFGSLDEVSLIGELNFLPYIPLVGHNIFTPFIFAGIGTVNFKPQATYQSQDYDLRYLQTEGQATPYKESAIAIPYGAGIKYNFAGQWNFIVDLGYRTTNTGYLDDVYGAYADKSTFGNPTAKALSDRSGERNGAYVGSAGSQRGNYRHDTYMFLGFTISYTFLSNKCYTFN